MPGSVRLGLLRHAKSAYPDDVPDARRPLADRGRREAALLGPLLMQRLGPPDLVLVSPATRTRQTWELASTGFAHHPATMVEAAVYDASVDDLLLLLRSLDKQYPVVLVVGHNPGLEELAAVLSEGHDTQARDRLVDKFPTSALAVLRCDRPWSRLVAGCGEVVSFDLARE